MLKYVLLLKAQGKNNLEEELEFRVKNASRVPVKGEVIDFTEDSMNDYFESLQIAKYTNYAETFGDSKYEVTEVEHRAFPLKNKIETIAKVIAKKI